MSLPPRRRDPRPIGVFDSGVGGLTVLSEIRRRLPTEPTVYLGDNARTPYGPRSDEEVRRFSAEGLGGRAARCDETTGVAPDLVHVYAASPEKFSLIAKNKLGDEAFATPAFCGGRIYARVAERAEGGRREALYCLGKKE